MTLLAIDFGGTRIRAATFDAALRLQARAETWTHVEDGQEAVIARIIETAQSTTPPTQTITAIGVAAPGPLDAEHGIIHHAHTLPGWRDVPLAAIMADALGAPAFIQNDANLAALAEYERGEAAGADPLLYLTISTGIGGGAVIAGELFTGWRGLAIEPGHMRFTLPDGSPAALETLASGTAIGRIARERLAVSDAESSLRQMKIVTGQQVGDAARQGDALALAVIQEAATWLGLGLVNLVHLFNPQVIILGGSVTKLGDLLLQPARAIIARECLNADFSHPDLLRITQLGDDICLIGAAAYARKRSTQNT